MSSSESLSSPQNRKSVLLSRKRLLAAVVLGLVAIVLSYFLGQAHTADDLLTQYVIATAVVYLVFTPFNVLR